MKHLYSSGKDEDEENSTKNKAVEEEVVIIEISRIFENQYQHRRDDYRDKSFSP